VLRPFEPIRKVLTTNIPGLDTLGININLLNLAKTIGVAQERAYNTELIDAINSFSNIIDAVDNAQTFVENLKDNRFIDLGEFSLSASGEIVNPLPFSIDPITQASNKGVTFFSKLRKSHKIDSICHSWSNPLSHLTFYWVNPMSNSLNLLSLV
jgi:hypothetical protein